jgi:predicted transcriptional regulator
MATARSKLSKAIRKFEFEKLYSSANLGAAEIARRLNVTPRTVRNYLKGRREELCGPEKVYLHLRDQAAGTETTELLTIEDCAKRLNMTPKELNREIWRQRRDYIASVRAAYQPRSKSPRVRKNVPG